MTDKTVMLTFTPVPKSEFENVLALLKLGLFEVIDEVFGWDDAFQRQRIKDDYHWSWMHWVNHHNDTIGLICFKPYDQALHLHLILLYPDYQRQGFGQKIMAQIHAIAREEHRDVTLSAFKKNVGAVRLYQKLGYRVEHEEEHFLLFRLPFQQDSK